MPPSPTTSVSRIRQHRHEAGSYVAAEDAALALLELQLRVVDLERENRFLRGCIHASTAAPHALAVTAFTTSRQ